MSLLNCLEKVAEKIIAARLSNTAETSDLLDTDQIDDRRQKSAIDAVLSLVQPVAVGGLGGRHQSERSLRPITTGEGSFAALQLVRGSNPLAGGLKNQQVPSISTQLLSEGVNGTAHCVN